MEKVRQLIKEFLIREYVNRGRVISFQELQNMFAYIGFHYYLDEKGRKKLKIGKRIYPIYLYHKRRLSGYIKKRQASLMILDIAVENFNEKEVRKLIDLLEEYLTVSDKNYYLSAIKRNKT